MSDFLFYFKEALFKKDTWKTPPSSPFRQLLASVFCYALFIYFMNEDEYCTRFACYPINLDGLIYQSTLILFFGFFAFYLFKGVLNLVKNYQEVKALHS